MINPTRTQTEKKARLIVKRLMKAYSKPEVAIFNAYLYGFSDGEIKGTVETLRVIRGDTKERVIN